MKRIECEATDCNQILSSGESYCETCGQRQTTRSWLAILLLLYYPIFTAVTGLTLLIVIGLLFPVALGDTRPGLIPPVLVVVYILLAVTGIQRYLRRRRCIRNSTDVVVYDNN